MFAVFFYFVRRGNKRDGTSEKLPTYYELLVFIQFAMYQPPLRKFIVLHRLQIDETVQLLASKRPIKRFSDLIKNQNGQADVVVFVVAQGKVLVL